MDINNLHFIFSVILSFLADTGESIKCLQCTTLLLQRGCDTGELEPIECRPEENYCIRYVGDLDFGSVIFRDCNVKSLDNVCDSKIIEGQNVHVCYHTCDYDGCNDGPIISNGYHSTGSVANSQSFVTCVLHVLSLFCMSNVNIWV